MMPNNRRKGRTTTSSKPGKSKSYNEKNIPYEGVFGNPRFMHAATSLVGSLVQIQVRTGEIFEGVFMTFSKELELVLDTAHKVSRKSLSNKSGNAFSNLIDSYPFDDGAKGKLIFKIHDVVWLNALSVDTDFAIKDNFTDTAISKFNGQVPMERELEPWEGPSSDSEGLALVGEDDGANGWDANDMFRLNAEKYGVTSSYDKSLHEYTVPLTKKDTDEYKMKEAQASKIAGEIEKNNSYQERIQLENGDEEDRFSAVVRPENTSSKYVLPQKRRNVQGPKRQNSTTSLSPVHGTGPKPYPAPHTSASSISNQASKQYMHSHSVENKPPSPPFQNLSSSVSNSVSLPPVPKDATEKNLNEGASGKDMVKSMTVENVPSSGPQMSNKHHVMCPPSSQTLPPRIERRRENEKKLLKQKGRNDEIAEFKKFSSNFKLTEENKDSDIREDFICSENKCEQNLLANKLAEQAKIESEDKTTDVSKSTLNPNAKEFVFNPNAKSFTPRSMSVTSPHTPVQPQRMQAQSPVIAVPHSQIIPGLPQPLFTAMAAAPQYVMQATPVSMALTTPYNAASLSQAPRFRKLPLTMQPRHEITPSMHVAAATGQPILAPAAMPTPSQLTMQYANAPRVIHTSGPHQQAMGYPQMNVVFPSRVVPPQQVGVVPTSQSFSYCDTSQLPTHLLMSAHPGASIPGAGAHTIQQNVSGQHSNHHPPQSQTPGLHPSPSPVHQVPTPHGNHSQPPTPTTVMYPAGAMGQHPLQTAGHHNPNQPMNHPLHQAHHPGFPSGPQPVVLMQQQQPVPPSHHGHQASAAHHLHMHSLHSQNPGNHMGGHILPQMTIIPTSAAIPATISTPPYVQHPQGV